METNEYAEEVAIDAQVQEWDAEAAENNPSYIKMDFSLETPEERNELVKKIIADTPPEKLTQKYIEKLADYIIFAMDKEERKTKKIITDNRMVTVNKRETSFEGLIGKLENGEDGIYNMIANDKNIIFAPKVSITEEDIETIPGMKQLREAIEDLEKEAKHARGKRAYILKKNIIELRQDQYVLKNMYKKPIYCTKIVKSFPKFNLDEKIYMDENGEVHSTGKVNLFDQFHISILLCNYSRLKQDSWDNFNSDIRWLMMDLDNLIEHTFKDKYPLYYDLIIYKIDGLQNIQIQEKLYEDYGIKHSVEYISSLWRNKIPKMIAETAANEWLEWHFTFEEKGKWKKCSRCGQVKLAHNHFFSKNSTSKDGFYSICKDCRNKKNKE